MQPDPQEWANAQKKARLQAVVGAARETLETADLLNVVVEKWIRHEIASELSWDQEERDAFINKVINDSAKKNGKHAKKDSQLNAKRMLVKESVVRWSELQWGHEVEAQFLAERHKLDQASLHILVVENADLGQELFHRLKAKEATFQELHQMHGVTSFEPDGCYISPRPLKDLPYRLGKLLHMISPGELLGPLSIGNKCIVAQLETFVQPTFTAETKSLLLKRRFHLWATEVANLLIDSL